MQNLEQLKFELDKVNALITKWIAQGYTPSIERGVALSSLEKIYEGMTDFQTISTPPAEPCECACEELEPEVEVELILMDEEVEEPSLDKECQQSQEESQEEMTVILGVEFTPERLADFTEELFAGDAENLKENIAKFEQMPSFEDALIYVGENFSWSPSSEVAVEFIEMLENYFQTI